MERVFKAYPQVKENGNSNFLNIWRTLGPISIQEVLEKSKIKADDLDFKSIGIKHSENQKGYAYGMINK